MALSVDCPVCSCTLSFNPAHHGRPGLCLQCQTALVIPAEAGPSAGGRGGTRVFDAQSVALKRARALAKAAVAAQRLSREEAEQYYKNFARRQKRGERSVTLESILVEEGVLTPGQCKELATRTNREDPQQARRPAGPDDVECPNCFETIAREARSCRFCGEYLAQVELLVACANCGVEHPKENVYCSACSAEIRTGLMRGMQRIRCPRCGNLSQGMEEVCMVCRTPLKLGRKEVQFRQYAARARDLLYASRGYILLLVALWAGLWLYRNWKPLWYGEQHLLRARVESFQTALEHRDFVALAALVRTEQGSPEPDAVKQRWQALTGLPEGVTEPAGFAIDKVEITGGRASVYYTVSYVPRLDLGALDPTKLAGGTEKAAGKLLKATRNKTAEVKGVWRFERQGGVWYYGSPW